MDSAQPATEHTVRNLRGLFPAYLDQSWEWRLHHISTIRASRTKVIVKSPRRSPYTSPNTKRSKGPAIPRSQKKRLGNLVASLARMNPDERAAFFKEIENAP